MRRTNRRRPRPDSSPFIAWGIVREMVSSMTDDQIATMDEIVTTERRSRTSGEDPRQRELFGAQAIQGVIQ